MSNVIFFVVYKHIPCHYQHLSVKQLSLFSLVSSSSVSKSVNPSLRDKRIDMTLQSSTLYLLQKLFLFLNSFSWEESFANPMFFRVFILHRVIHYYLLLLGKLSNFSVIHFLCHILT